MFQENNFLWFTGNVYQLQNAAIEKKLHIVLERHKKLHNNYEVLTMLCLLAIRKKFKLVIENPQTQPHYLNLFWCIKPSIIDKDRHKHGDYFKKPTQYWFINFEPYYNFYFENQVIIKRKKINKLKGKNRQRKRSMISDEYADWFVRTHLIQLD